MNDSRKLSQAALEKAKKALHRKDHRTARRWAEKAASLAPDNEQPWIFLAALASPRASLAYLKRALIINPNSSNARRGMRWAIKRWREKTPKIAPARNIRIQANISPESLTTPRSALLPWALLSIIVIIGMVAWFSTPTFSMAFNQNTPAPIAQVGWNKATRTFTPTPTATFTPTPTATFTPTLTNTPTVTPNPTNTPIPTETRKPSPTQVPVTSSSSTISLPCQFIRYFNRHLDSPNRYRAIPHLR
jgi:hypothetical protein